MKTKRLSMPGEIFIAMLIGILVGVLFKGHLAPLKVVGDIFIRLIQMGIILLIMGQVIEAVGRLNIRSSRKIILEAIGIFLASSLLAAVFGILMASVFHPGSETSLTLAGTEKYAATKMPSIESIIEDFVPSNIVEAMAKGNVVQTIIFSLVFGAALSSYCQKSENTSLLEGLHHFNDVVITMIRKIMIVAPLGVFALIASSIGNYGMRVITPMFKYLLVYGVATLIFLILWLLVVAFVIKRPVTFLIRNMTRMSTMALATTSSAITLPVELEDAQKKLGIEDRVAKIVLNLGMSLNSNGSAMHMALTIVTIAQIYDIHYSVQTLAYVAILATLSSLANAVVPGAALVSLTIVVPQMGLPIASIAMFAGIDWFVGMLRTILNVDSDVFSALIVAKHNKALASD